MQVQMLFSVTVPEPVWDGCALTQQHYPAGLNADGSPVVTSVTEDEGAWLIAAGYAVAVD